MDSMKFSRTQEEIRVEIAQLKELIKEANRRSPADPEAEIAASLFRQLIRRRERQLAHAM